MSDGRTDVYFSYLFQRTVTIVLCVSVVYDFGCPLSKCLSGFVQGFLVSNVVPQLRAFVLFEKATGRIPRSDRLYNQLRKFPLCLFGTGHIIQLVLSNQPSEVLVPVVIVDKVPSSRQNVVRVWIPYCLRHG